MGYSMRRFILVFFLALLSCSITGAAVLQYPSGTMTTWDGAFRWQGKPEATWYLLEVWYEQTVVYRKWYQMSCTDCTVTVDTVPPGAYQWQILDWGAYGYGEWSGFVAFSFEILNTEPPPSALTVPDDEPTLQGAIDRMTNGGTITLRAGAYYGNRVYADERTASIVLPNVGDWTIIGETGAVITYDPNNPPLAWGYPGTILEIKSAGSVVIDGVHFVGTMELGDGGYDRDICVLMDAPGNLTVRNSEFEKCGHAGVKHYYPEGAFLIENNRFHDNGFTTRDHHTYMPGGGEYIIRYNTCWNSTGWCVGYGNVYATTGAEIYGNASINSGGCVSAGIGQGNYIHDNFCMNNVRGLWLQSGGSVFRNNTFLNSTVEDVYSERACGALITPWCDAPLPNVFYNNGNIFRTVSHPDRIE